MSATILGGNKKVKATQHWEMNMAGVIFDGAIGRG